MAIKAHIPAGVTDISVHGLRQWDYGQTLEIHDDTLPAEVEVHFAHVGMREAVVRACNVADGVTTAEIPDICLEQSTPITAWVYVKDGSSGETTKTVTMHIVARPKPQVGEGAKQLNVQVVNKTATYSTRDGDIVCGNGDYTVKFTFDPTWDGVTDKMARFVWNGQYFDKPINEEGVAEVPVIDAAKVCLVGVYSETMRTTTSASIGCRLSIRCQTDMPNPGHGQNYSEIAKKAAADAAAAAAKAAESASVVQVATNNVANALKGNASGEVVALNDVSPIAHEMGVSVRGKNLLPNNYFIKPGKNTADTFTYSDEEQKLIMLVDNSKDSTGVYKRVNTSIVEIGKRYAISVDLRGTAGKVMRFGLGGSPALVSITLTEEYTRYTAYTTITSGDEPISLFVRSAANTGGFTEGDYFQWQNMQIELVEEGATASTTYAPYIEDISAVTVSAKGGDSTEPVNYPVGADGTVQGVTPIYPNTTLLTDTAGAIIDCTYNRDINKAFLELQQAILAMGV